MNFKTCDEKELWEYVASFLSQKGIRNILVGGAVAAIYSKGGYSSGDLDIVIDSYTLPKKKLSNAMAEIGFANKGKFWVHPDCGHLYVEFLQPPLAIGDEYSITPVSSEHEGTDIYMLSPEDCVKDRLASYIYFKARECFDQAVLVARAEKIDLSVVEKWCRKEGGEAVQAYADLCEKLELLDK